MKNHNRFILSWLFLLTCSLALAENATFTMVDPTRPPTSQLSPQAAATTNQPFQLTATFIYSTGSIAIINGHQVKVGEEINGYLVTSIMPFTVELVGPDKNREVLQLVPTIKQAHP